MNRSLLSLVAISAVESAAGNVDCNTNTLTNNQCTKMLSTTGQKLIINGNLTNNTNSNGTSNNVDHDCTKRLDHALKIIKESDIICFDVDSTVIIEEGIDELANYCGKGSEVAKLTKEAMGGSMTFQDALKFRLDIIKPTQRQIREFLKSYPSTLSPGIKDFINHIRKQGKDVYLISGGFDCLIEPVATELGIPMSHLFANKLMFYFNGEYAGFDTTQPTSRSGGKGEAISIIRKTNPEANITMIGDGATDLEAVPPANSFIGYGGNIVRKEVQARAQYYVTDFNQLFNL